MSYLDILDNGPELQYVIIPRRRLYVQYSPRHLANSVQRIVEHVLDLIAFQFKAFSSGASEFGPLDSLHLVHSVVNKVDYNND